MKQRREKPQEAAKAISELEQPALYDLLYTNRGPVQDDLLTTVLRAAETLTASYTDSAPERNVAIHAVPKTALASTAPSDYSGLRQVIELIQRLVREDQAFAAQLNALPAAFGEGSALRFLFNNLFPNQHAPQIPDRQGKPIITNREVEILRLAAYDRSHEDIASECGIARATVRKHLNHIYRALNVHKPLPALIRAAALGYVEWDSVDRIMGDARGHASGFDLFQEFCANVGNLKPPLGPEEVQPFAAFGLLLLVVSGAAARQQRGDTTPRERPRGVICAVNAQGEVVRRFGGHHLRTPRSIALAPHHAARQGFTPGNLFVACDQVPQRGLNRAEIAEFTPAGDHVRTFHGSDEVGTRLIGPLSLAFTADGRLLVTTGWLTNAILAFMENGATVQRFCDDQCVQVCVAASGRIYVTHFHTELAAVKILDHCGQPLGILCESPRYIFYNGIAVSKREHLFVVLSAVDSDLVQEYDPEGTLIRTLQMPPGRIGQLAVDGQDRLILPYKEPAAVLIVGLDGTIQARIALEAGLCPMSAAAAADGTLFVCCAAP